VQVRTADGGTGDPDEDVGGALDPGIRHLFDGNLAGSAEDNCSHIRRLPTVQRIMRGRGAAGAPGNIPAREVSQLRLIA
jgi:hypothetical protein